MMERRWTIYKYELDTTDKPVIKLPQGSEPLHVNVQYDGALPTQPRLWARVPLDVKEEDTWVIMIVGTGHEAPPPKASQMEGRELEYKYLNTFFLTNNRYVFHAFACKLLGQNIKPEPLKDTDEFPEGGG